MIPAPDIAPLAGHRALVLGAGVAGLAAATALCRFGAAVELLEQAPDITEVGAGLQISPNGVRVLRALGIDPPEAGDRAEAVELRDNTGRLVTRLNLPAEPGFFLCHRADLIAVLERAMRAAGAHVQLLQKVEKVTLSQTGACVTTAVGARHDTPLVIGADGLHSRLRPLLNGEAAPFFTGQVAWRAVIPGDAGPPVAQVFMGPGRHLVSYPLRGGRLRNIVAVEERRAWAAEGWNQPDDPEALRAAFAGFGGPVPGWLAAVSEVFLWGLFRHPVASRWTDGEGRAAILGDAAHPTLPFMAQGANMALEDAWSLAAQLAAQPDDPAAALARYEARRAPRTGAIVGMANRNARNYHLRPPVAPLAHAILRMGGAVAPGAALRRFAWIYDHDVTV
ncbi:MAG: FAD-dependent monooxygenase [Rhodobacter sp.]|nr:FAD-dependent monooxygenase [Paracoccaceae bacterium]MCC0076844.1 FAD-dependent monooxygenase [Rhodobacter sp.]